MPFDLVIKLKTLSKSAASLMLAVTVVGNVCSPPLPQRKSILGHLARKAQWQNKVPFVPALLLLWKIKFLLIKIWATLWSERRKFSGAVIRRAVELSGLQ